MAPAEGECGGAGTRLVPFFPGLHSPLQSHTWVRLAGGSEGAPGVGSCVGPRATFRLNTSTRAEGHATDTHTRTHTDTDTDTDTHRHTETRTHKHTHIHTHRNTHTYTHIHTQRQTHRQTNRDTHTLTHSKSHAQKNTQTHTQRHRQRHKHKHRQTETHTHREPCRPTFIQHLFMFSTREALNTLTNVRRMLDEPAPCYQCMCLIMAYGISFSTPVLQTFLYRCRSPRSYPAPVSWPNP